MLDVLLSKQVLGPVIIIIGFSIVYQLLKKIIRKALINKISKDDKRKKTIISLINNLIKYFFLIIAVLMILSIYGINTTALITSLGVVGVMAGLALQDILKDFLAGISIITEDQYEIGDTVTINGFRGEILSLGIKTTSLRSFEGDVKYISNRNITEVINHSRDFSLAIIDLSINYDENIEKVEKVLNKLFEKLNKEISDLKGEIKILGVEDLSSSSVVLRITAETKPLKHFEIQRLLKKEIKEELDRNNIEIPYDQLVVHNG